MALAGKADERRLDQRPATLFRQLPFEFAQFTHSRLLAGRTPLMHYSAAPMLIVTGCSPSISPVIRSPGESGPTPAGVPVKMRSPGTR